MQIDPRRARRVCLFSIGTRLAESVLAAREIEERFPDVSVTVADARFLKPLDSALVDSLAKGNEVLVTIEEGSSVRYCCYCIHTLFWFFFVI